MRRAAPRRAGQAAWPRRTRPAGVVEMPEVGRTDVRDIGRRRTRQHGATVAAAAGPKSIVERATRRVNAIERLPEGAANASSAPRRTITPIDGCNVVRRMISLTRRHRPTDVPRFNRNVPPNAVLHCGFSYTVPHSARKTPHSSDT